MSIVGIQYRNPFLYNLLIPIIHKRKLMRELRVAVGKNQSVFEVAAGFGRLKKYIDQSNKYSGIDLNEKFIKYAQERNIAVSFGDIFDPTQYKNTDVTLVVDVIHHLPSARRAEMFDLIFKHTQCKVIVLEPAFLNFESRHGRLFRPLDKIIMKMDSDGVNKINGFLTREEYVKLFEALLGSRYGKNFDLTVKIVKSYYIVVYEKRLTI